MTCAAVKKLNAVLSFFVNHEPAIVVGGWGSAWDLMKYTNKIHDLLCSKKFRV